MGIAYVLNFVRDVLPCLLWGSVGKMAAGLKKIEAVTENKIKSADASDNYPVQKKKIL